MTTRGAHHVRSNSQSNNHRAQLANAYQELAKELGSDKLKVVGGYTLGRVIGEGTYGSVHIATHRLTGTRVAIKKIPKALTSQLTREIHHHRLLHHQHILHLHEVLATETHIWLVTELCTGGELFDYLVERGRLLEGEGRRVFGELVVAVGVMHQKGTVHRDLKLENVLLDGECKVKLGDLGFAREWTRGSRLLETYCGTTGYASPEMLQGKKYSGEETDIWSLGIILYALLCGGLPFDDDDEEIMKKLIIKGEYEEPEWLSDEAKDLIHNLLQQDPSARLSIKAILSHAWFNKRIVDPPLHTIPGAEGSLTPAVTRSPEKETIFTFDERSMTKSPLPDVVAKWNERFPAPTTTGDDVGKVGKKPTSSKSVTLVTSRPDSDGTTSDASFDFQDSEKGKTSSGLTTPTTAEGGDVHLPDLPTPKVDRSVNQGTMALLQSNESQSTIRKGGEDTLSRQSSGSGTALASRGRLTVLEGQREEDESEAETSSRPVSYVDASLDFGNMHLPVALHSRTPSRTKRRSVSSTLSDRRPTMHSGNSFQANETPVIDYLGQLCLKPPPLFSTPAERQLLNALAVIGFDTGQLVHSVMSDACDASGATWWLLRAKQAERHDDESMTTASAPSEVPRTASTIRETPREEAVPSASFLEISTSNITAPSDGGKTPRTAPVELGKPAGGGDVTEPRRPSISPIVYTGHLPPVLESPKRPQGPLPSQSTPRDGTSPFSLSPRAEIEHSAPIPPSPVKVNGVQKLPTPQGLPGSPSSSPNKRAESSKTRSASFSMLQRATSVFGSAGLSKKKSIEKVMTSDELIDPLTERKEKGNKLTKVPPPAPAKDIVGSRSSPQASATEELNVGGGSDAQHDMSTSSSYGTVYSLASGASSPLSGEDSPSKGKAAKTTKKDGLLTTFRSWFNEDRRKRKRAIPGSPVSASGKVGGHQMNRVASVRSQYAHAPQRITVVSRINAHDLRPAMHSRRSSSANSRRSSIVSMHAQGMEFTGTSPLEMPGSVSRKHSGSRRSVGSRTPTSERDYGSRPSSLHGAPSGPTGNVSGTSLGMHGKSASIGSTDSTRALNLQSPGHRAHFRSSTGRSAGGRGSRGSLGGPQYRTNSTNSSRRSSMSRRSSAGEDQDFAPAMELDPSSDVELSHDDASIRSKSRRRRSTEYQASVILARRTKSPLSSNMSFADSQRQYRHSKSTQPVRDVFAKKREGNGGVGDDDWISEEDEESGYAGGLGQLCSKVSAAWGSGQNTVNESGGSNAGGSPKVRPTSSLVVAPPSLRKHRDKDKKASAPTVGDGESGNASLGGSTAASSDAARDTARPHGRGLNSTRPTRIVEEDEEEE